MTKKTKNKLFTFLDLNKYAVIFAIMLMVGQFYLAVYDSNNETEYHTYFNCAIWGFYIGFLFKVKQFHKFYEQGYEHGKQHGKMESNFKNLSSMFSDISESFNKLGELKRDEVISELTEHEIEEVESGEKEIFNEQDEEKKNYLIEIFRYKWNIS